MNKFLTTVFSLAFCAGMAFISSSCSNDDSTPIQPNPNSDVHRVPIAISSTLDGLTVTRAGESNTGSTAPKNLPGDCGVLFKPTTSTYSAVGFSTMYTYTPSGAALNLKTGSTPYYPATSDGKVNIRGWYPASVCKGIGSGNTTFTVESDQSSATGYTASDLMIACVDGQAPTTSSVNLPFVHKLAKVTVVLKLGSGVTGTPVITMKGVKPSVTFNIENVSSITSLQASGTAKDILLSMNNSDSKGYSAVIPAQAFSAGATLFTINMSGGKSYTYTIPTGSTQRFVAGKQNVFTFTLTGNGAITLTNSVTAWDANATTEATL